MEPGMAKTSRPATPASRAVISDPDFCAASTTSVPWLRPAMMRFRCGKHAAQRRGARREFRDQRAAGGDAFCQRLVIARVDLVEPAAENGDRGAVRGQRALVTGGVDSECEAAGDGEAGAREE